MAIPRLKPESEKRLSEALNLAIEDIDAGQSPNIALAKAASAMRLPAGQIKLLVRAYNIGRTLSHIESGKSRIEKAAAFPLADVDKVLELAFPSRVKSASAAYYASAVSDEYAIAPDHWLRRRDIEESARRKSKKDLQWKYLKYACAVDTKHYLGTTFQNITNRVDADQLRVKEAKLMLLEAGYQIVDKIERFREYCKRADAIPVDEIAANCSAMFGKKATTLISNILDRKIAPLPLSKAASLTPVDWNEEPYSLISSIVEALDRFHTSRKQLAEAESLVAKSKQAIRSWA